MAFQPETQTYEAGVYQLETTDPVQGGVGGKSNAPLLHLANRTAWLKQQVDNLLLDVAAAATANSPAFTGDPTAPTATAGDNDTSLATTAFVQYAVSGVLSLSVAGTGTTTLTAAQAGAGVLVLTGALTGARTVVVPNTGRWIVRNATTGAFSLTVKTATGMGNFGVIIPQGTATEVFADGTNAYLSGNVISVAGRVGAVTLAVADVSGAAPLASPTFTGAPAAPTPAQFDNDTSIATTEWVNSRGVEFGGYQQITANTTLTAADCGELIQVSSPSATITLTLPLVSSVQQRAVLTIVSTAANPVTLAVQGSDIISANGAAISDNKLRAGDCVTLVAAPGNTWMIAGGTLGVKDSGSFGASFASNGWQRLPSGLIIQWGGGTYSSATGMTGSLVTLPISFPNAGLLVSASDGFAGANPVGAMIENKSQIRIWGRSTAWPGGATELPFSNTDLRFIAIGY